MTNVDKDYRYMATSDLFTELQKDSFKLDGENEKKICAALLKLLEDSSGDVQGLAVQCLGPLVKKIHENQLKEIVDKVTDHLLSKGSNTEVKDIASIGLKKIIAEVAPKDGPLVVKRITGRLIDFLRSDIEEKLEALDILSDIAGRFGSILAKEHETVQDAVLPHLTSNRTAVRKRAISCIAHIAVSLPDKHFNTLIQNLIQKADTLNKTEQISTLIQAIGSISRSVGFRMGKFLAQVLPILVKYAEFEKSDDELREHCFHTFESLILRCPKEVAPHIKQITDIALVYIKYDPNYAGYDDDEGEEMETEEAEEEDQGEDETYSDDDDLSWKVRRSSAKVVAAVISSRPELLEELYRSVVPVLLTRFREREENVKLEIFATLRDLLRQTVANKKLSNNSVVAQEKDQSPTAQLRKTIVPKLLPSLAKELKQKSFKIKIGAFQLLRDLTQVEDGLLTNYVKLLVPGIKSSLIEKNNNPNVKMETLSFLRALFSSHPPATFHPHLEALLPPILQAVSENYYKIVAEALRVCHEVIKVLRPSNSTQFDYHQHVQALFPAVFQKLKALDADQEVKECAIACTALLISSLGDDATIKAQTGECLRLFLERLGNEITRPAAIRALSVIGGSEISIDLSPILTEAITQLTTILRQNSRQLKQSSLVALDTLMTHRGAADVSGLSAKILSQLAPLISEADLHLSHLALTLTVDILKINPSAASQVRDTLYPQIQALIQSPLLQGLSLESLLALHAQLVQIRLDKFGFEVLLENLLSINKPKIPKQCVSSISQCIAVIVAHASNTQKDAAVGKFIQDVKKSKDESSRLLGLLTLGEIGRLVDLSGQPELHETLVAVLDSPSEETALPSAASFALGNVAVGNLSKFLPKLLHEVETHPKREYLLLHSIREVISRHSTTPEKIRELQAHMPAILPILYNHCQNPEEGTRNVVAECLGKLALVKAEELVPKLQQLGKSPQAPTRATAVTALKFAVVEQPHSIDPLLQAVIGDFLHLLQDSDLSVRRAAMLTFNFTVHNKPVLVTGILSKLLVQVFQETKIKPELIREVEMGPFKHRVDDGLDLRKAAFECMYTVLESCFQNLDVPAFLSHLAEGLKDTYDIKMLCHLMLSKLAIIAPAAVLEELETLVEPLRVTVTNKCKDNAVKQDLDRNEELVRSALRAVVSIARIPNVEQNIKFEEFLKVVRVGELGEKYETIRKDTESSADVDSADSLSRR
eukprot:TRINITY_DN3476_c0_g1_i1.p1 TRINITY_DN3476_c0_g1~~TRINITY_DN3476_c0_g1_i1.p1  ORF type:complete len:1239 (+),score=374.55 TRINITY_DN3476_c0_g1_i1:53-3718(+)